MSRLENFDTGTDHEAVGRGIVREGKLTPNLAQMLGAATGHASAPAPDLRRGALMPYLWHWAAFPEFFALSELGADGHPALGGFLPDLGFPRRMWAGGKLSFKGQLHVDEMLYRSSQITAITRKDGASGAMVFVKVAHSIVGAGGGRIEEEQDIVYLNIPETFTPPKRQPAFDDPAFAETVPINEARLFRYSAATFNAHRIHYDLPYTQEVEKYPALVVHGPMQATMLLEAACRYAGRQVKSFRFRGLHPMFHSHDLQLQGHAHEGGMDLGTAAPEGYLGMQAQVEWL